MLKIRTSNEEFYRLYHQALEDMAALRLPIAGTDHMVFVPAAGLPWFVAPFGRDSLIVSLQNMLIYPDFARGALDVLGALQAKERRRLSRRRARQDPARAALRRARAFQADPAHAVLRHGRRHAALSDHAARRLARPPATTRCWSGICRPPKAASTGSTTTATATATGSRNTRPARRSATRTWPGRTPATAVVYPDGTLVKGPKALCELQGYVYDAWLRMAEIFDALGKPDRAARTARQGRGAVRPVQRGVLGRGERASTPSAWTATSSKVLTVASNPGHLPVVGHRAAGPCRRAWLQRLMAPDMWSGWGIRTLSAAASGVQPVLLPERLGLAARQRHHRTRLQALRLRRGGGADRPRHQRRGQPLPAQPAAGALCGDLSATSRAFPVQYLGANVPQAWAAGSVFALLQAMLGIQPDAPRGKLYVDPRAAGVAAGPDSARPAGRRDTASTSGSGATATRRNSRCCKAIRKPSSAAVSVHNRSQPVPA